MAYSTWGIIFGKKKDVQKSRGKLKLNTWTVSVVVWDEIWSLWRVSKVAISDTFSVIISSTPSRLARNYSYTPKMSVFMALYNAEFSFFILKNIAN